MEPSVYNNDLEHARYLQFVYSKHCDLIERYSKLRTPLENCQFILSDLRELDDLSEAEAIEEKLIESKSLFSFFWAFAEIEQEGKYSQRGKLQSEFADLTIELALRLSWYQIAKKQPRLGSEIEESGGRLPGLFVMGLGKLGGFDLNFSSDVDLIAFFDPSVLPVPNVLGQSYICHQVLQCLTRILGRNGDANFIWRVDWRLRPNASATTLAMSTEAALDYYYYRASPWHRLALMKARIIAGDKELGQTFIDTITPFIWRQNLDYRALDELGEIKNKINIEHPALRSERKWREPISDEINGYNIKLGTGGIREIEFIANALQLVWGGKHYELRTSNTLEALAALKQRKFLPTSQVHDLSAAYKYFRHIENTLQIMGNQQTHRLPDGDLDQACLLSLLRVPNWEAFRDQLNRRRESVAAHFESLFAEQAEAAGPPLEWPEGLSEAAAAIVKGWENGFIDYGISRDTRTRFLALNRALSESIATRSDPSATVIRLHEYFRSLPQGEQYFRLLAESPKLLNAIISPLLHSPPMASLLKQSPHIVDCFMHAGQFDFSKGVPASLEFDSQFVLMATNYEVRLERIRRFVNENLYQLYLALLQDKLQPFELQRFLTQLAIHTLELSMRVVSENMNLEEVPVAVVGLGKMGVARMAPASDLDLIFIFDPDKTNLEVATRFVSRLDTAISTPMREGVVYELDTRLRPSGRSGAPTVSVDSFRTHHLERAHTWEHIALVSASVIAGDSKLKSKIEAVREEVLFTPRDQEQLIADAQKMWLRVSEHRVKPASKNTLFSKLRVGGLMQAEYMAAVRVLQAGAEIKSECSDSQYFSLLKQVEPSLIGHIDFWQNLQIWERLLGLEEKELNAIPHTFEKGLLADLAQDSTAALAADQEHHSEQVEKVRVQLFKRIKPEWNSDEWVEKQVTWL